MLEVSNLYCGYGGADIIRNISFKAESAGILCIIGPNGCGKTTLLKSLVRLLDYRGSVTIDGCDLSSFSRKELAKKIALLSQTAQIYFPYTVYDTIAQGRYAYTKGFLKNLSGEDRKIIRDVIEGLQLEKLENRRITELSGGQLQSVFLARTLVQDPDIILVDEPTNHLDLKHQVEILEYLSSWAKENRPPRKRTLIAVLHDLNLVRRFADTAALIHRGELAAFGKAREVLDWEGLKGVYGMDIKQFMRESLEKWTPE